MLSFHKWASLLFYEAERIFRKSFGPTAVNKELTSSVVISLEKNFILRLTCDKVVLCIRSAWRPSLEVFPHKREHGENSHSPLPHHTNWKNSFWIISHKLKSHRPNRNLGIALILTVNSHHQTLLGLIADSLYLTLWMLFSIHGITPRTMAGCLWFAIWLCILFKAVLSKYQSGFPSGCLFAF